jgi:hypothetical protein
MSPVRIVGDETALPEQESGIDDRTRDVRRRGSSVIAFIADYSASNGVQTGLDGTTPFPLPQPQAGTYLELSSGGLLSSDSC